MNSKKRVLSALVTSLFATAGAQAQTFSNVYVFGDSLSDAGYYRPVLLGAGVPANLVSVLGRFTTNPGPVWSEIIIGRYTGTTGRPSNVSGGTDYAQGGARVALASPSTPTGAPQRPVSTQITEHLGANGGAANPDALYAVWAGGNDFLVGFAQYSAGAITATEFQTNFLAAATAEIQQIGRLRAAGARYIAVFAMPDVSIAPALAGADAATRGQAQALAAGYNTSLFAGLAGAGLRVIPIDVFTLFGEVKANAAAYGFTNTTGIACGPLPPFTTSGNSQFCYSANLVAPNADTTYMFADSVHPTTGTQRIIADFTKAMIEGPAHVSLLPESAVALRNAHVRTLWDGGASGFSNEVGGYGAFVSIDGGNFDIDPAPGTIGVKNSNNAFTIGATARATESALLGVAVGKSRAKATFGGDGGGYSAEETAFSAFGAVRAWEGFSAAAALTIANLDWKGFNRNIVLGQVTRVATAVPQGSNASFYANAAWDFRLGNNFTVGPLVAVASQNVEVQGFDEAGAGSANLRYGAQKRRSEVWKGGARAAYTGGGWSAWARVTADKERRDDPRFVSASPLSLATGSTYDIPAYQPDTTWIEANFGVRGEINKWVSAGLMFNRISGRSGVKEDGITGSVSFRF